MQISIWNLKRSRQGLFNIKILEIRSNLRNTSELIVPISPFFRESRVSTLILWSGRGIFTFLDFFAACGKLTQNERLKLIAPSFSKLHPQAIDLISALNKVIKAISMSWGGILWGAGASKCRNWSSWNSQFSMEAATQRNEISFMHKFSIHVPIPSLYDPIYEPKRRRNNNFHNVHQSSFSYFLLLPIFLALGRTLFMSLWVKYANSKGIINKLDVHTP